MAHFAQLDENNVVTQIIVVANEDCQDGEGNESEAVGVAFCQSLFGADTNWKQTSYNNNFRYRYASIGGSYDETLDVFREPQPFNSWTYNSSTYEWEAPVPYPDDVVYDDDGIGDKQYNWSETDLNWVLSALNAR